MTDDQTLTQRLDNAKDGDILSEVKENNPYHVIYDTSEVLSAKAKWYVVHTYSGHENKAATTLKQKIESQNLKDKILDIIKNAPIRMGLEYDKKSEEAVKCNEPYKERPLSELSKKFRWW